MNVRSAAAEASDAIGLKASNSETRRDKINCSIFQKQTLERPSSNGVRGSVFAVRCLLGWFAPPYNYVAVR